MTDHESPAPAAEVTTAFETLRPRLVGVAYGILGTLNDAEDAVQEAWIRLQGSDVTSIGDLPGWLITATARIALDTLRAARTRREEYVGPWLPEPIEGGPDPADAVDLADAVSWAMLVVLETLSPAERAAFVLHDVFAVPFDEVGKALGKNPTACRKLASRARQHVEARQPRYDVDPTAHHHVVTAFGRAATSGDVQSLLGLLHPDAVLTSDGGGLASALPAPLRGARPIAQFLAGVGASDSDLSARPTVVNASPALLILRQGRVTTVLALGIRGNRIATVDAVRNPDKFHGLRHPATSH